MPATARQKQHVRDLARTGIHTVGQIADMTGVCSRTVRATLRRADITVPDRAPTRDERHVRALVHWHAVRGLTTGQTARVTGMSARRVQRVRIALGIGGLDDERRADRLLEVARLTRSGVTACEISRRVGVSVRQVERDRASAGVALAPATPLTDDEHRQALALLRDGASYPEAARTIGRSPEALRVHYPGFTKPRDYAAHMSAMTKALNAIPSGPTALSGVK